MKTSFLCLSILGSLIQSVKIFELIFVTDVVSLVADSHPIWKVAAEGLPVEDGEYLVVVESLDMNIRYTEICDYDKKHKSFTCWDHYNDSICTYKKKDIKYWMKIPDYK